MVTCCITYVFTKTDPCFTESYEVYIRIPETYFSSLKVIQTVTVNKNTFLITVCLLPKKFTDKTFSSEIKKILLLHCHVVNNRRFIKLPLMIHTDVLLILCYNICKCLYLLCLLIVFLSIHIQYISTVMLYTVHSHIYIIKANTSKTLHLEE